MPPWKGRTDDGFYQLVDPLADPPFRGHFEPYDAAWPSRADARPEGPVTVRWAMGGANPTDVVWTTAIGPFIVGPRVIGLLQRGGFSGWESYPVDLFDKSDRRTAGYVGIRITGRCDPVDWSRSELVLREYPGGWFPSFRGVFFPPGSWDGCDLFVERSAGGTGAPYGSARLARALRNERIRNLKVQHTAECEMPIAGMNLKVPPNFEAQLSDTYARLGVPRPETV